MSRQKMPARSRRLALESLEAREMFARTTGLMVNTNESFPGYTLFAPSTGKTTYLIDQNGQKVHSWDSQFPPMTAQLMPNGDLVRAGRMAPNPRIHAAGSSGIIERYNWEGDRTWYFELSTQRYRLHHDFEVLPNGNILVIAWEFIGRKEALARGRDPAKLEKSSLWPDTILEIEPQGASGGKVVWQWRMWDHLLQNRDPEKPNFLSPAKHPERLDINYRREGRGAGVGGAPQDWAHTNGVDYDPKSDQIILSSREFSELWVIDHSTTKAEAKGRTGGKQGRGGDILFRWGNPAAYEQGNFSDQVFSYQHDAQYIRPGLPGAGNILVFNNGWARADGRDYASVDEITPPLEHQWLLNDLNSGTDFRQLSQFDTGEVPASWLPVKGDWNGDGRDSIGLYDPVTSTWHLNNDTNGSTDDVIEVTGWNVPRTWRPITGDWDHDGSDSIGFYDPLTKTWHLNNKLDGTLTDMIDVSTPTAPDRGTPLAGDWNGDGVDTIGFYDHVAEKWYFANSTDAIQAWDLVVDGTAVPNNRRAVVGDWDNDGDDSPGLFNPATTRWTLSNELSAPTGSSFGGQPLPRKYLALAGNWDGQGGDSVGLYNSKFLFGTYVREAGKPFGPTKLTSHYVATPRESFFAAIISGAQRLPNGNTLIDEGTYGRIFEVNPAGKIVWQYVNPVTEKRILAWNEKLPPSPGAFGRFSTDNLVFRAYRYGLDYSAFDGRDLSPKGRIERYPNAAANAVEDDALLDLLGDDEEK